MSVGTRKGLVTELMNDDENLLKWKIHLIVSCKEQKKGTDER